MNTYNNMKTNNAINKNLIYEGDQGDSTYFRAWTMFAQDFKINTLDKYS